jgi:uncharacterized protein YciI
VPLTLRMMEFIVIGTARVGFVLSEVEEDVLNEQHWAYMDHFARRLVARSPLLSVDGTEWEGSVHIIDVADRRAADRFAFQEPYWVAGQYVTCRLIVLRTSCCPPCGIVRVIRDCPGVC